MDSMAQDTPFFRVRCTGPGCGRSLSSRSIEDLEDSYATHANKTGHTVKWVESEFGLDSPMASHWEEEIWPEEANPYEQVKQIIERFQDEYEHGVPLEGLVGDWDSTGAENLSIVLDGLKRSGEVYEPRANHLRVNE